MRFAQPQPHFAASLEDAELPAFQPGCRAGCRLTTTVPEWDVAQWTEVGFEVALNSLVVHRRATAPKPMRSGTIVHSIVPASAASLQNALATLQAYFRSYACNPWRTTAVGTRCVWIIFKPCDLSLASHLYTAQNSACTRSSAA